jgi:hypothetical protein
MIRLSSLLTVAILVILILLSSGSAQARSAIFDEPKADNPETIVVPAGTKIVVDISEENPPRNVSRLHTGKVVNIVQVGSTVAIPALSKVTIQHSVGTMELTEVTIDGGTIQAAIGSPHARGWIEVRGNVHAQESLHHQTLK